MQLDRAAIRLPHDLFDWRRQQLVPEHDRLAIHEHIAYIAGAGRVHHERHGIADGGVEMRMPDLDKGDAIRTVLKETSRNTPVAYLGDDLTDERAFRALGSRGLSILVRTKPRRTAAQVWLKPPDELLDFLSRWLAATETTQLARSATY